MFSWHISVPFEKSEFTKRADYDWVLSQLSIQRTVSSYYQGFLPVLFRLEKFWCLLHNNLLLHLRHWNSVSIIVRCKWFPALTKLDQVLCHFPPYRHPEQICWPHNVFFVDLFDNVFFSTKKKRFLLFMRRNVILHYLLTLHFGVGGLNVHMHSRWDVSFQVFPVSLLQ